MRKLVRSLETAALSGLMIVPAAFANLLTIEAETTATSPTYERLTVAGSPSGISVLYDDQGFYLNNDAICEIYGNQEGPHGLNGFLAIYRDPFDPASPTSNFVAAGDDLRNGSTSWQGLTRIPDDSSAAWVNLPAGRYHLISSGNDAGAFGLFENSLLCVGSQPSQGLPPSAFQSPDSSTQVFLHNLFPVSITWQTASASGQATPARTGTVDTAKFWFFSASNWEVMIKILDACAINGHYWVFYAPLTNQGFTIDVQIPWDLQHPKIYSNDLGHQAESVLDTNAIACP